MSMVGLFIYRFHLMAGNLVINGMFDSFDYKRLGQKIWCNGKHAWFR